MAMDSTKNQVISKKLYIIQHVVIMFDTVNAFNNYDIQLYNTYIYRLILIFTLEATTQSNVPVSSSSQHTPGAPSSQTPTTAPIANFTSTKSINRKSTMHTTVFNGTSSQPRKSSSIEKDSQDIESTRNPNTDGKYDRCHLTSSNCY